MSKIIQFPEPEKDDGPTYNDAYLAFYRAQNQAEKERWLIFLMSIGIGVLAIILVAKLVLKYGSM